MAKVKLELTCTECGKTFIHRHNCYNRAVAQSYEEWAKDNITICPECYFKMKRAEERAKIDAQTTEALDAISDIELPGLTGTEPQIALATEIRARAAKMFKDAKATDKAWELFRSKTDARWWIEHRDYCNPEKCSAKTLFKTMLK